MTMNKSGPVEFACPDCGRTMDRSISQIPMWMGAELKLIDNVPVHQCAACGTEAYEPAVEAAIRALVATGFPDSFAVREVSLPVFDLDKYIDPDLKKKEDAA